jgi:hypothetical protein
VRWRRAELKKLRGTRKHLDHLLKRPTGPIVDHAGIWFALAALIAVTWMARFLMNTVPPFENPFLSLLMWIGLCLFGTDQRNGVSFDQQDGSAVGGFQGRT